jgi:PmbA protein
MSELLELAQRAVGMSEAAEEIEAFFTHEREFQVKVYDGEVDSLSSAEPRGAGIRVLSGGRVGFSFTSDLSDDGLKAAVQAARENSRYATEDDAIAFAPRWTGDVAEIDGMVDAAQPNVTPDQKIDFTIELERITRSVDTRIRTEEAVYSDSETEAAIATSTGVAATYRRTDAICYSVAIATEGDDTQIGFEFDLARGLAALDAEDVARHAAEKALTVLGADKIPSGRMPIVLDPYVAGRFLGVIGAALTGEAVQKGRSLFAGKLGESVAAANVTMIDDGRAAGAPGSAPWDAEGVPTQRTRVISSGTLEGFLYDITSAKRDGRESTGNASRAGFKSGPGPSPTNLTIETTGESREDVFARAGTALWVHEFHGVHSGTNAVSGDFSVGVTATLLENGEPVKPVKEVTIAAPMLEILSRIECVADDLRWLPFGGAYGGATTLVSEMTIAGS